MPVRLQNDGAAAAGEEQPAGAGVQGGQAVASARLLLGARGGGAGRGVGGAAGTCFVGQELLRHWFVCESPCAHTWGCGRAYAWSGTGPVVARAGRGVAGADAREGCALTGGHSFGGNPQWRLRAIEKLGVG